MYNICGGIAMLSRIMLISVRAMGYSRWKCIVSAEAAECDAMGVMNGMEWIDGCVMSSLLSSNQLIQRHININTNTNISYHISKIHISH